MSYVAVAAHFFVACIMTVLCDTLKSQCSAAKLLLIVLLAILCNGCANHTDILPAPLQSPRTSIMESAVVANEAAAATALLAEKKCMMNFERHAGDLIAHMNAARALKDQTKYQQLEEEATQIILKLDDMDLSSKPDLLTMKKYIIKQLNKCSDSSNSSSVMMVDAVTPQDLANENSSVMMVDAVAPRDLANENSAAHSKAAPCVMSSIIQCTPCDPFSAFNWSECIICQTTTGQQLTCPVNGHKHNASDVYVNFAQRFYDMAQMSEPPKEHFKLQTLFQQSSLANITAALLAHEGKWHKDCFQKYDCSKKARLEKRTHLTATLTDDMLAPTLLQGPAELQDSKNDDRRKSLRATTEFNSDKCIFCQLQSSEILSFVMTVEAGARFYKMASELRIEPLLTYLTFADKGKKGVEEEMKYHRSCSTKLYNSFRAIHNHSTVSDNSNEAARAFCNIIQYITSQVENLVFNFKFPMLAKLHQGFRDALGVEACMNEPIFKEKLTQHFESEATWIMRDGKTFSLCFHSALQNTAITVDDKFKIIAQCANILRRSILNHRNKYDFATAQFKKGVQEDSVPHELLALFSLMFYGGAGPDEIIDTQPVLTISQVAMIHTKKTAPTSSTSFTRRNMDQDTPLPLYVSLYVYHETKNMKIVQMLYNLGIGVHPNRVSDVVDHVAAAHCEAFKIAGDVVPPMLVRGQFLCFHGDNVDWQTTSTHSKGDLHGTALTAIQGHVDPIVHPRIPTHYPATNNRDLKLPLQYTTIDNFPPDIKNLKFTSTDRGTDMIAHDPAPLQRAFETQRLWVSDVALYVCGKPLENTSAVSWPTWQANLSDARNIPTSLLSATKIFLPVSTETFATVKNIAHLLKNGLNITEKVNPGQIVFICFDQPPFSIARALQIKHPVLFGRHRLFLEFGPLHIEMNLQNALGQLLKDSGWVELLKKASIYSADSCLGHTNAMRTRNAITISMCALAMLQLDAFMESLEEGEIFTQQKFEIWVSTQLKYPNFQYWDFILRTQNLVLIFVSAVRNRDVVLYIDALEKLVPLMFVLDHQNYARWLSVFVNDLRTQTPSFRLEYAKNFSVYTNPGKGFSAMGIDQHGEQMIKMFKSPGGQSSDSQNEHALLRDNIAHGPIKKMMDDGLQLSKRSKNDDVSDENIYEGQDAVPKNHHSYGKKSQERFVNQVLEFKNAVLENGNVFSNTSADLIALDTAEVMPAAVASSYAHLEQLGIDQYNFFKLNRIERGDVPIDAPLKKNKVALFSNIPTTVVPKDEMTICNLKNDAYLFSRALTAKNQGREISTAEILKYEQRTYPPALATYDGKLRKCTKSDILPILQAIEGDMIPIKVPDFVGAHVLDGPAVVHMLKVITSKKPPTFKDYFLRVFNPYILHKLESSKEVFVAFDVYKQGDSLKVGERRRRGAGGKAYRVGPQTPIPKDWHDFLRNDKNKEGLFFFLADCIADFQYPQGKRVYASKADKTLHSAGVEDSIVDGGGFLGTSNHEEADTRMFLCVAFALAGGAISVEVRSVDSDAVVIALSVFRALLVINQNANVWVTLGTGTKIVSYHINAIFANLETEMGPETAFALAFFSTFTGCDTVSSFFGKGKSKCFAAWRLQQERITRDIIGSLKGDFIPLTVFSAAFQCAEILAISFYDNNSEDVTVNEARVTLSTQKKFDFDLIPPTQAALLEHANRAFYQARVWVQSLVPIQNLPSPSQFGWHNVKGSWEILWSKGAMTCTDLKDLVSCKCKKEGGCKKGYCKCFRNGLPCTDLCLCKCDDHDDPCP